MKMYILFYGKRKKLTNVTINGLRYEVTSDQFVDPCKWSGEAGIVIDSTSETRQLNYYFDELKQRAYEIQRSIIAEGKALDIFIFKEREFICKKK